MTNRYRAYFSVLNKNILYKTGYYFNLISILTILLFVVSCSAKSEFDLPSSKPNIIIIVADDLGWRDIGYNGSEIKTPALDKLANENIKLTNFYVSPTCSPTRAALISGKYPSRFGILGPIGGKSTQSLPRDVINLPTILKSVGYNTALTGKWHLGLSLETGPNNYGFEYTYGFLHGQIDQYKHVYKFGDRTWHRNGKFVDEEGHATDLITNESIKYITEIRDKSKPFFLAVTYSVPHFPLQEEEKWVAPYKETIENDSRRIFAASVAHMDDAIARIINTVQNEGLKENTLILFMSDNGGQENWIPTVKEYNGEHGPNDVLGNNLPLRDWKKALYEGGIRVPAIISYPDQLKQGQLDEVISVTDILPTIAHVVGFDILPDTKLDGKNIWNTLSEGVSEGEREIYGRTKNQIALRKGDWKLIHKGKTPEKGRDELYNLKDDPYEKNNIAKDHPEIVKIMLDRIKVLAESDVIVDYPDAG